MKWKLSFILITFFNIFAINISYSDQIPTLQNLEHNSYRSELIKRPRLVFFGTSTFLLEINKKQILIDSYLSRFPRGIWHELSPDGNQLQKIIHKFNICPAKNTPLVSSDPLICHTNNSSRLEWIIPLHGHYDHALDAGVMSLWSGGRLVGDASIEAVLKASKKINSNRMGLSKWRSKKSHVDVDISLQSKTIINTNQITIKLIRTPHGKSPVSWLLKGQTNNLVHFPMPFWRLKEGTSLSLHLKSGKQSYLFVPSPGEIGDTFSNEKLQADIVFLGIGGTCLNSYSKLKALWKDAVLSVSPKKVFLIHWDNTLGLKPSIGKLGQPYSKCIKDRVMKVFRDFALEDNIPFQLPPFLSAFDPYSFK